MNDDIFGITFIMVLVAFAVAGIVFFALDFRHFTEVANQCEKQGFIQNKTMRIQCRVEKL